VISELSEGHVQDNRLARRGPPAASDTQPKHAEADPPVRAAGTSSRVEVPGESAFPLANLNHQEFSLLRIY